MHSGDFARRGRWLAAVSAAFLVGACGKAPETAATKPGAGGPPPVNVTLVRAKAMELQRSVRVTGNLVGLETPTISNRVTGRVTKVLVDRGDRVKPGQTLLEIEPDRFRMSVDESRAALAQTLARLGVQEIPGDNFDVNQTAPVKKAKSQYDLAKEKMDRTSPLHDAQRINDFEFLAIVSDFRAAESTLENSRDEARALLAQARQNRAALEMRQKDHADSVIVAPDGSTPEKIQIDSYVVNDRKVSPGEYVREGTALFTLIADRVLKLQARVPERYLGDVKEGANVTFRVEAYPDEEFSGKVTVIHPAVDEASRTFMVEAQVDNAKYNGRLRPGSFVPGEVLTKKDPGRVMVPLEALTSFVGVTKLFKLDPKANPPKVKSVDVSQGQQEAVTDASGKVVQWVEIVKGDVAADDQVVVSGMTKLVDGSAVKIAVDDKKPTDATAPEARK